MNAVSPPIAERERAVASQLVLRVLSGRSEGAEHRLPERRKLLIGHSFESDIVLRDKSTLGCSLRLTTCGRRGALEVLSGNICVLGRHLNEGEQLTLEPYLPVRIGDIHFALGGDSELRWAEVDEMLAEDAKQTLELAEEAPPTDLSERLELRTQPVRREVAGFSLKPARMAVIGAGLLTVAGGAYFGASMLAPTPPTPRDIRAELAPLGMSGVSVERSPTTGDIAIVGLVKDGDDLAQLREWADEHHPNIIIGVATISEAAEAATNLLVAQNVDAEARPQGARSLIIESPFLPKDRQQELTALLQKDLPRVKSFTFNASAERGETDLAYFFNAPGYGAASFVAGDPGFIVTEDGTRWFAGASLPTGHTIIEIGDSSVTVEREGLRDTLTM